MDAWSITMARDAAWQNFVHQLLFLNGDASYAGKYSFRYFNIQVLQIMNSRIPDGKESVGFFRSWKAGKDFSERYRPVSVPAWSKSPYTR